MHSITSHSNQKVKLESITFPNAFECVDFDHLKYKKQRLIIREKEEIKSYQNSWFKKFDVVDEELIEESLNLIQLEYIRLLIFHTSRPLNEEEIRYISVHFNQYQQYLKQISEEYS